MFLNRGSCRDESTSRRVSKDAKAVAKAKNRASSAHPKCLRCDAFEWAQVMPTVLCSSPMFRHSKSIERQRSFHNADYTPL